MDIKKKKQIINSIESITKKNIYEKLNSNLDMYYDIIMDLYTKELNDVVTDRDSKSRPEDYMDLFFERLKDGTSVEMTDSGVEIKFPNMDTFNFDGLDPIKRVLEGTPGKYVEISLLDFENVFGTKAAKFIDPDRIINPEATKKKDKYIIVPFSGKIDKAQKKLGKKFVVFPFSNVPPIRILEQGNIAVSKIVKFLVKKSIKESQKEFKQYIN